MAYIDSDKVLEIRKNLNAEFPNYKFSVRKDGNIALDVCIMKGPTCFEKGHIPINRYSLASYGENEDFLRKVYEICNQGNYDRSDIQCDYHDVGWYFSLYVGKYNQHYVQTA